MLSMWESENPSNESLNVRKILVVAIACLSLFLLALLIFLLVILINPNLRLVGCPTKRYMIESRSKVGDEDNLDGREQYEDISTIDKSTTIADEFTKIQKFIVSINYKLLDGKVATYCVGSVLTPFWVLTSSLCLHKNLESSRLHVRAGTNVYNQKGTIHRVDWFVIPDWRAGNFADYYTFRYVGLIKVLDQFNNDPNFTVLPTLPPQENGWAFLPDYKLYTAGWGTFLSFQSIPLFNELRPMASQVYDISVTCKNYMQRDELMALKVIENVLCVGDLKAPSKDECNVDAGAPLTHLGVIRGISWSGMSCKNYPTVYVKVALYTDWILNITGNY